MPRCHFSLCSVYLDFAYQTYQELVPVGHVDNVVSLAGYLEFKMSSLHKQYFGLPLGAIFTAKVFLDEVLAKIEYRLDGRKWITLIKRTLSNLPTYFISLCPSHLAWLIAPGC